MRRRLIEIIPLDALRVFECTARHMNFSAAARELSVTQAAISRRILQLEDLLGFSLYQRSGRRLALTPKGERLFLRVQTALEYIGGELDDLTATTTNSVVSISAASSVSHLWLSHRLRDFNATFPEISVTLTTTNNLSDMASNENCAAVIHSKGSHPDWILTPLFSEELIPVASPEYLQKSGVDVDPRDLSPEDLTSLDLYDYGKASVRSVTLRDWFEHVGCKTQWTPKVTYSTYMMAVDSALRGDGIVLGCRVLIEPHLSSGALIELTQDVFATGFSYYLALPKGKLVSGSVEKLADFLLH